jgi:hypothetical protein
VKGILFNVAQEVVVTAFGEDTWDQLLEDAGADGAYTSLGSYPDAEFLALVAAAEQVLGISDRDVVRFIGERAIPLLVDRYPGFFEGHTSARDFVLTLNQIIHPEVMKLYPGAEVPDFDFSDGDDGELVIGYRSSRRLCALAEGFLRGSATHYGETVRIDHATCMLDGADGCRIRCWFGPLVA